MNMKVQWRFGEDCEVTDFVTPSNLGVRQTAQLLKRQDSDKTVEVVAEWIRDGFNYPLTKKGEPSAAGYLKRYQYSWCKWNFSKYVPYMWAYPNELLLMKKGICIATANLCTSVLCALGIDGWTAIGEVRYADTNDLIGYHAWTELPYKETIYSAETTVEDKSNILYPICDTYDRCSAWACERGIYYIPQGKFNHVEYRAEGPLGSIMLQLIGLPHSLIIKKGFYNVLSMAGIEKPIMAAGKLNTKAVEATLRKDMASVVSTIREAYHV